MISELVDQVTRDALKHIQQKFSYSAINTALQGVIYQPVVSGPRDSSTTFTEGLSTAIVNSARELSEQLEKERGEQEQEEEQQRSSTTRVRF